MVELNLIKMITWNFPVVHLHTKSQILNCSNGQSGVNLHYSLNLFSAENDYLKSSMIIIRINEWGRLSGSVG